MPYKTHGPAILDKIKNAEHILLVSHEKPDGDTLGASLAIAHFLNQQNKKYKHFCSDQPAHYFSFLPLIEHLITDYNQINLPEHDVVITIDCGDINRTKIDAGELKQIKRGEWNIEKVKKEADKLFTRMEKAYNKSKLPEKPNNKEIDKLVVEITTEYYK